MNVVRIQSTVWHDEQHQQHGALLTIPIYIAQKFCNTLFSMMITSGLFSMLFTIFGLIVSYNYDLSSGPSIILVSSVSMFFIIIFQFLKRKVKPF